MLLERFLPRIEFDSYEDYKQNFTINVPESFNFGFDVVDAWAEIDDRKPALVWCDDHGGEERFSFGDLKRLSNQAVHFFKAQGIGRGDTVMVILRRRFEYWICAAALHKLGAIIIPSSVLLTSKDIVYRVSEAEVKMLVCVADDYVISQVEGAEIPPIPKALVAGNREGWLDFSVGALNAYSDVFPRPTGAEATQNEDIMLVYFTSGTTGMPKMVRHNFMHPLGHIITAKYWQCVQDGGLHMSVSDSGWAKFGWGKIYGQWICGAVIFAYDMDKFVPEKLLEKMAKYKLTTFCAPPTMYRFMLEKADVTKYDLSSIQRCCNAGEPLSPEVFRTWKEATGHSMAEGFGQSESPVLVANFPWFEPRPGSMGKPSPLYDIELLDEDGNPCETGVEGELVVRHIDVKMPVGLFTGYYKNEELTQAVMGQGFYNTGDVAWRDSDGYFWFVGRNDDVIKCSGYRISPFEVESALVTHPAVLECAITGAPDELRGQVVKATIVLKAGYAESPELVRELQNHVKTVTAPYKYPRLIDFVPELPKTFSGKIKRAQIRHEDEKR